MTNGVELEWGYDPQTDSIVFKGHVTSMGWANLEEAKVLVRMLRKLPKNQAATFLYNMAVIFEVAQIPVDSNLKDAEPKRTA
jgi:hypothetical protein